MALIAKNSTKKPTKTRRIPVSTKLSEDENARFRAMAGKRKQTESGFMRDLILAELQRENTVPKADPLLTEIVGVRILLINLLKPLVTGQPSIAQPAFEALLEEVRRAKGKVAADIQRDAMGAASR